jgi:hypothetical protein
MHYWKKTSRSPFSVIKKKILNAIYERTAMSENIGHQSATSKDYTFCLGCLDDEFKTKDVLSLFITLLNSSLPTWISSPSTHDDTFNQVAALRSWWVTISELIPFDTNYSPSTVSESNICNNPCLLLKLIDVVLDILIPRSSLFNAEGFWFGRRPMHWYEYTGPLARSSLWSYLIEIYADPRIVCHPAESSLSIYYVWTHIFQ